jgi:4-amino-4-deoxy-L-arabinose transferase-like glycosyltransferase
MTRWFGENRKENLYPSSAWSSPNLAVLLSVLVVAAGLRYYGLSNADNTDEYNEVFEALRVASGRFNVNRWHKKGFQNLLAVEYGIYFGVGYVIGLWRTTTDFAATIIGNLQPLFLIGRYTTATMGTLSVVLLYWIGCRLYNPRVALVASALFAVCTMHVWTSHLVNTDIPLTFFFLLSLAFVVRFYFSGSRKDYCIAAVFAAVTVNVKIIGVGILVIYGLAHLQRNLRAGRTWIQAMLDKQLVYAGMCFVGGLLVSNPAILVGFKQWLMYFVWQYGIYTNVYEEVPYAMQDNGFYTYAVLLFKEFGPLLMLLTVIALILAVVRRTPWDIIFLGFLTIMYGILGGTTFLVQNRYLMTLVPVLFLIVGVAVDQWVSRFERSRALAVAAITILLAAYPLYYSVMGTITLTEENTNVISKRWIEEHIATGSRVLIDGGHTILTSGPRLNQSHEKLEEQLRAIQSLKEGETYDSAQVKIVDSYSSIYFELLLKSSPSVTYNLTTTELGRRIEPLEYYVEHGFQYYIHNIEYEDNLVDQNWRTKYPLSTKFFESLDTSLELMKTFEPSGTRSGPIIKAYRFRKDRESSHTVSAR